MASSESAPIRQTVHYSGRVQGVGFRYTTEAIAARFAVTGFVRNLSDGRVELVIEGEPAVLEALHQAVTNAMDANIREASVATAPATGEFSGFRIAV